MIVEVGLFFMTESPEIFRLSLEDVTEGLR
jgi:hypothetical protein